MWFVLFEDCEEALLKMGGKLWGNRHSPHDHTTIVSRDKCAPIFVGICLTSFHSERGKDVIVL